VEIARRLNSCHFTVVKYAEQAGLVIRRRDRRQKIVPVAKKCRVCGVEKPIEDFPFLKENKDGRRGTCRLCFDAKARENYPNIAEKQTAKLKRWREEDPERFKGYTMRARFGISLEERAVLFEKQGFACAGCGAKEDDGKHGFWMLDHDHNCCPARTTCGKCIRGILCRGCNFAIGSAKDSPEVLRNLATYVENHTKLRLEQQSVGS